MNLPPTPIAEEDLHAYADNRLDGARLAQVETWLAAHPEHRLQVESWREQSSRLHRVFDTLLDQPIPTRLLPPANSSRWLDRRRVAAVGWLFLGGVVGFLLRGVPTRDTALTLNGGSLPHLAAVAHAVYTPEVRHPVEVGADQEAHLASWLSKRLGAKLTPPKLEMAGYLLVGGRLLPGDNGEGAQFMYENAAKKRLTLYVQRAARESHDTSFRHASEGEIDVFYWVDGRFGYALSGSIGHDDMLTLATLVYHQLSD